MSQKSSAQSKILQSINTMLSRINSSQDQYFDWKIADTYNAFIKTESSLQGQFFFQQEPSVHLPFHEEIYHQQQPDPDPEEISNSNDTTMTHKTRRKEGQEKDYGKHIFPNMVSKLYKLIFKTFKHQTQAYCSERGWNFKDVQKEFQFSKFTPSSLSRKYLPADSNRMIMIRQIFFSLLQIMLRRRYVLSILRTGKMDKIERYIEFKKYVLYFRNHFE